MQRVTEKLNQYRNNPQVLMNDSENLRLVVNDNNVHYTPLQTGGYFAVIRCQDKAGGKWDHTKQYCGFVPSMHDNNALLEIMHNGSKPYSLKTWFSEQE